VVMVMFMTALRQRVPRASTMTSSVAKKKMNATRIENPLFSNSLTASLMTETMIVAPPKLPVIRPAPACTTYINPLLSTLVEETGPQVPESQATLQIRTKASESMTTLTAGIAPATVRSGLGGFMQACRPFSTGQRRHSSSASGVTSPTGSTAPPIANKGDKGGEKEESSRQGRGPKARTLKALSKQEFAMVDADGDGEITAEEWQTRPVDETCNRWKTQRYIISAPDDGHWGLIGGHPGQYPTLKEAGQMQRHYYEMSNEALLLLCAQGNQDAAVERMIREVMHVDQVHWRVAAGTVQDMEALTSGFMTRMLRLPYTIGATAAFTAAAASIPLCFSVTTALWFNDTCVTAELPPPDELETVLECGMWTWGWMEPPLGVISFFLLCLQFARNQTSNMWAASGGQGPYNAFLKRRRYNMLREAYPYYSPLVLGEYSATLTARAGSSQSTVALNHAKQHGPSFATSRSEAVKTYAAAGAV